LIEHDDSSVFIRFAEGLAAPLVGRFAVVAGWATILVDTVTALNGGSPRERGG